MGSGPCLQNLNSTESSCGLMAEAPGGGMDPYTPHVSDSAFSNNFDSTGSQSGHEKPQWGHGPDVGQTVRTHEDCELDRRTLTLSIQEPLLEPRYLPLCSPSTRAPWRNPGTHGGYVQHRGLPGTTFKADLHCVPLHAPHDTLQFHFSGSEWHNVFPELDWQEVPISSSC